MSNANAPVIHWFRRDLRLRDNIALHHACEGDAPVIALFIFDPDLLQSERVGAPRLKFLLDALQSLDERLKGYDTRLLVRHGQPANVLQHLISETDAKALYANRDYSPYARRRDADIENALTIPVHIHDDALLIPPGGVMKDDGDPYVVFTPFKKKWNENTKPEESVRHFRSDWFYDISDLRNDGIPTLHDLGYEQTIGTPEASEDAAIGYLKAFIEADITQYDETRNYLPIDPFIKPTYGKRPGTSYLSPYLRLGLLSPRQAYWAARQAYSETRSNNYRESIATWVSELTWREFYAHILYHFPHVMQRDFVDTYDKLDWQVNDAHLQAWYEGATGYPIVDAPMRQMKQIGWMPNRARMIVASFLTKDLLIHWKPGDVYFMQHLIDGDPASNNGGWQWAAGTGTDAQPYFRIFNPVSQSKKHATADYLRHWLPELKDVPDEHIHEPWRMKNPPKSYPAPIVDHQEARERTLAAFKAARGS